MVKKAAAAEQDSQFGAMVILPGSNAMYTFSGMHSVALSGAVQSKVSEPAPPGDYSQTAWSFWGDDNLFPENVVSEISANAVVSRALKFRIDAHYGNGVVTYKKEIDSVTGAVVKKIIKYPAFEEFKKWSNFSLTQQGFVNDFEWYWNIFPELIMSKDGKKIAAIKRREANYSRWARYSDSLNIDNLFFSYNWPSPKEGEFIKIPALDNDYPLLDLNDRQRDGGRSFILPIRLKLQGALYYNVPFWNGIRLSWLPVATDIPKMKAAILENQMVLKWHIRIALSYWTWKYKNWTQFTQKEKDVKVAAEITKMNNYLSGAQNAGKSFLSFFDFDPLSKAQMNFIQIEPLNEKLADGMYTLDSSAANSENLFGIGVNPAIFGQNSPGGAEAGSGSNIREATWAHIAFLGGDREKTLYPYYFIRDFNGWDPDLEFGYINIDTSQTLDKNPSKTNETL